MTEKFSQWKKAARDDWQTAEMPPGKVRLSFARVFSPAEFELLAIGFIPRAMEQKWFIFLENDNLYFHRSWTGIAVYQLLLARDGERYHVAKAWVNPKALDDFSFNETHHAGMIDSLITNLLLRGRTPAPPPASFANDPAGE